ncbi:amidohydrolase [Vulcanibacillus modesticaldus]|uniref:Amidohydrolase n=1 Tax=Vulcanibacillus modesticaldus TaxID=337097 RepID=A0A1D2YUY0_9BACI|nr:amidohydrolase [Vulcanibacillus modesticaldus]OEF99483.1 amidohydrolase [Vulcanibacillus modesticaldus]
MIAITNAKLLTVTKGTIENGVILIEEGKIKAIGEDIEIPGDATIIDGQNKWVTPGLIDAHTHLGVFEETIGWAGADGNEMTNPSTPHVRALDAINPLEQGFVDAYMGGITTVQIMPGSANVIGGEMSIVKTYGRVVEEMLVKELSGIKVAFGENPKRVYGEKKQMPSTRMGTAAVLRENLTKAKNYMKKMEEGNDKKSPEVDLQMESLIKVIKREIPLRAHAHRADDIMTAIRIAEEFEIDLTLEHCTEGHIIADIIAEKGYRAAVGPTLSNRSKIELGDRGWHTLVELDKAGVPVSIITDHPVVPIEYISVSAAIAVREGLDEETALKAITINPARHMGVEDKVGSLEVGKDADVVIWSGNPFDFRTKVEVTIINGKVVYQREM